MRNGRFRALFSLPEPEIGRQRFIKIIIAAFADDDQRIFFRREPRRAVKQP